MNCRFCKKSVHTRFVDLGSAPPSNAYLASDTTPEQWCPLRVLVCENCWLVQTEDFAARDQLFTPDYAYFSSFSKSWLAHAHSFQHAITTRLKLNRNSHVIEVAANDGYLLQYFKAVGIPCLGIEPTASTAQAAQGKGIEVIEAFFGETLGRKLATQGRSADLIVANNVLAHAPDINDFTRGFAALLKPQGVSTFEFPSLRNLVANNQFDTIYHEHFSYLSLTSAQTIFAANGLHIFDVEDIPTHGGSLRVYAQRTDSGTQAETQRLHDSLRQESELSNSSFYQDFQTGVEKVKNDLLSFLIAQKNAGKSVAAYGAAAKGSTLLNYAGIKPDLISFVYDANPSKQQKFMPGSRIPIRPPALLSQHKPDWVIIFPWNIANEIMQQEQQIRNWGGHFLVAIPELKVFP